MVKILLKKDPEAAAEILQTVQCRQEQEEQEIQSLASFLRETRSWSAKLIHILVERCKDPRGPLKSHAVPGAYRKGRQIRSLVGFLRRAHWHAHQIRFLRERCAVLGQLFELQTDILKRTSTTEA